jgi:uncharacterized damage-inducible protein DinB
MIKDFADEYSRYKAIGQKAIEQVSDEALNRAHAEDGNSIAVIVRHISGNLVSRFTDFLLTDGEKPDRDRDSEFDNVKYSKQEVERMWVKGWDVVESQLSALSDEDLQKHVYIRGNPLTVHEALCRSLAHISYHVGQIVLLARIYTEGNWKWISIPKGESIKYNQSPTKEKLP